MTLQMVDLDGTVTLQTLEYKRGILLTDIAQTSNMLLDTVNIEICWRTLQISGSLSKDTVPIILYIF